MWFKLIYHHVCEQIEFRYVVIETAVWRSCVSCTSGLFSSDTHYNVSQLDCKPEKRILLIFGSRPKPLPGDLRSYTQYNNSALLPMTSSSFVPVVVSSLLNLKDRICPRHAVPQQRSFRHHLPIVASSTWLNKLTVPVSSRAALSVGLPRPAVLN